MRGAYKNLCGSLRHYWGYAPVRPRRRAEAWVRFSEVAPRGATLRGLGALGAPAMARGWALTPLANDNRQPIGGFDRRLGVLKTPRRVRTLRRYGAAPATTQPTALVTPFFGGRGGWGEKGRREADFLRADPWRPLVKRAPTSPVQAGLTLFGPTRCRHGGTQGRRGLALAATLDGPGPDEGSPDEGAPTVQALSQAETRAIGWWVAGLLGGPTPASLPPLPRHGRALVVLL